MFLFLRSACFQESKKEKLTRFATLLLPSLEEATSSLAPLEITHQKIMWDLLQSVAFFFIGPQFPD